MIQRREFKARMINACKMILDNQDEMTFIDSKFGDADHGDTMAQIAYAIKNAIRYTDTASIRALLDACAAGVLLINGGSSVPLWYAWLCGLAEKAPDKDTINEDEIRAIFQSGLDSICVMTKARVGDGTMMDVLIPATEAIINCTGNSDAMFAEASLAAEEGCENTRNLPAKFGRANNFGEATLGTVDAGAFSMMSFFLGLADKF